MRINFVGFAEMCQKFLGKFLFYGETFYCDNISKNLYSFYIIGVSKQALTPHGFSWIVIIGMVIPEFNLQGFDGGKLDAVFGV